MEFLDDQLSRYSENHSGPESDLLKELNRETYARVLMPRMLSGHLQGRLLSMISSIQKPDTILEIGTYTGYSALCLAEGLSNGGTLHTIDINDELQPMVRRYIERAGYESRIKTYYGAAGKIIPELNFVFDLIFIDADKINYSLYYDLVFDKLRLGGLIIADNVLWSGKVALAEESMDSDTRAIHSFNQKVLKDIRVEKVLLPVRDGLMIIRKVSP